MKTYFRLLSFAKPIEKFAIPYFIYTVFSILFNTLNFGLLIPLLSTLFDKDSAHMVVLESPKGYDVLKYFSYYTQQASMHYGIYGALQRVCTILLISVLLSNLFKYLSQIVCAVVVYLVAPRESR